jgi:hypothetical protein
VKCIGVKCTEIPLENPLGTSLGSYFPIQNPMPANDIIIEETNMDELQSTGVSIPSVIIKNIKATNITIPSIVTAPFEVISNTHIPTVQLTKSTNPNGTGVIRWGDADSGIIDASIRLNILRTTLRVKGGLEFKNLNGTVKVDSAKSDKFEINVKVKGIKLNGLNLCGMEIPEIMVEF